MKEISIQQIKVAAVIGGSDWYLEYGSLCHAVVAPETAKKQSDIRINDSGKIIYRSWDNTKRDWVRKTVDVDRATRLVNRINYS